MPDNLQVGGFSNAGRPGFPNFLPQQQNNLLLQQKQQFQNVLPQEQNNLQQQRVTNQFFTNLTQQEIPTLINDGLSQENQQQLLQLKQQQNGICFFKEKLKVLNFI